MHDTNNILVVSLSTETCKKAIHSGVSLAKLLGAQLYVLHSVYDPFSLEGWTLPVPSLIALRDTRNEMMAEARTEINRLIEEERTAGLKVTVKVAHGPLVPEVDRNVKEHRIDLLIMGAFKEGRIEHLFFSSAQHDIVRTMPCSVLLVKEQHEWETE